MPRARAGRRYPHITTDAKPHNHRMCPVVQAIVSRAAASAEPWGHQWPMPPVPTETMAKEIKSAFYSARYCREIAASFGEAISVQSDYERQATDKYVVWVKVWPRSVAMQEIVRRVRNKETLAYNIMRGD